MNIFDPSDDFIVGTIRYLREQGKTCEFLGFNILNIYVVLIDGIKYYGCAGGTMDTSYSATFFIVEDEDYDYIENRYKERVNQILEILENKK